MNDVLSNEQRVEQVLLSQHNVMALSSEYPEGYQTQWHTHNHSQLVYAVSGVLKVSTEQGIWITPPLRAIWIPKEVKHKVEVLSKASMRSLYIKPTLLKELGDNCSVIQVSALLRELIVYMCHQDSNYDEAGPTGRVVAVILDQLSVVTTEPLSMPTSTEVRLQKILTAMMVNPAENTTLEQWAVQLHMSPRTLSRLFSQQLNMSFSQCRHQLRLLIAIGLLAKGDKLAKVAHDVGFSCQSSFIKRFKLSFGVTPKQYFMQ